MMPGLIPTPRQDAPMSFPSGRLTLPAWPTALIPGLRLIWTRTLVPGTAEVDVRLRLRSLAWLILLPGLLLYPSLSFQLLEPDEGRYAEIAREMLAGGDWVVPHLQGEPYLDKPPLLYWLVALGYRAFGVSAAAARLGPALAVHGAVLVTDLFGPRVVGGRAGRGGAAGAGAGGARDDSRDVPVRPAVARRACGRPRGAVAGAGAGPDGHGPAADDGFAADALGDARAVRGVERDLPSRTRERRN